MSKHGRPATPDRRRIHPIRVLLTAEERAAAVRLAGGIPLATWAYQLVRGAIEREAPRDG